MNADDPQEVDSRGFIITPTLFLGAPPPHLSTTAVASSADAVAVIEAGSTALLPAHRWDLADQVLVTFGLSKAERASALMFAQHGVVLPLHALGESELDAALRGLSARSGQSGSFCDLCGFVEAKSLEDMFENLKASRSSKCPVCHGDGLPFDPRPEVSP